VFKQALRFLDRGISGAGYWSTGVALFLVMFVGSQQIAIYCLRRYWTFATTWSLVRLSAPIGSAAHPTLGVALHLLWVAPFCSLGILLTMRRLRTLGWPDWLTLLSFIPLVNFFFFIVISVESAPWGEDFVPGKALLGIGQRDWLNLAITVPFSLMMVYVSVQMFELYGWILFVLTPAATGYLATYFFNAAGRRGFWHSFGFSLSVLAFDAFFLILSHLDGVVCVLVGAAIVSPFLFIGAVLAFLTAPAPGTLAAYLASEKRRYRPLFSLVVLFLPALVPLESRIHNRPEEFQVQSRIEIAAPPDVVWQHVIAFSEIHEAPTGLLRTGVAYPIDAEIVGTGPGATRYCVFTTGKFVEPIHTWEQPRLLAFGVSSQPPVMQETMLPGGPPTLHVSKEYLRSRHGEFRLVSLPGGRTELIGTTWYDLKFWPATYWHFWTDAVIHRIHMRVLEHIKQEVEQR